ncbi:MAG: hypothetical protein AAFR84_21190 [Pseudomonadota bacterium]
MRSTVFMLLAATALSSTDVVDPGPAVSITASRVEAVAPATIFLDLVGVSELDKTFLSHDWRYGHSWELHHVHPDRSPDSKAKLDTGQSRSLGGSHCYTQPGTFPTYCDQLYRSAVTPFESTMMRITGPTLTILDPDVAIPAADTVVVVRNASSDLTFADHQINTRGVSVMYWDTQRAAILAIAAQENKRLYFSRDETFPLPDGTVTIANGTTMCAVDYWNPAGNKINFTVDEHTATDAYDLFNFRDGAFLANSYINGGWDISDNSFPIPGLARVGSPRIGGGILFCEIENVHSFGDVRPDASYVDCRFGDFQSYGHFVSTEDHRAAWIGVSWLTDKSAAPIAGGSDWGWFGMIRSGNFAHCFMASNHWELDRRADSNQQMMRLQSFTQDYPVRPGYSFYGNHFGNDLCRLGPHANHTISDPSGERGIICWEENFLHSFECEYTGLRVVNNIMQGRNPLRLLRSDFASPGRDTLYVDGYGDRPSLIAYNTVINGADAPGTYSEGSQGFFRWWENGHRSIDIRPAQNVISHGNAFTFNPVYARDTDHINLGISATDGRPFADRTLTLRREHDGAPPFYDFTGTERSLPIREGAHNTAGTETSGLPSDDSDAAMVALLSGAGEAWLCQSGETPSGWYQDQSGTVPVTQDGDPVSHIKGVRGDTDLITLTAGGSGPGMIARRGADGVWFVEMDQALGGGNLRADLATPILSSTTGEATFIFLMEAENPQQSELIVRLMAETPGFDRSFDASANDWLTVNWRNGAQFQLGQNNVAADWPAMAIATGGDGTGAWAEVSGLFGDSEAIPPTTGTGLGDRDIYSVYLSPGPVTGKIRFYGAVITPADLKTDGTLDQVRDILRSRAVGADPNHVATPAITDFDQQAGNFTWHSMRDQTALNVSGGGLVLNMQDSLRRGSPWRLVGTPGGTSWRPKPAGDSVLIDPNAGFNYETELPDDLDMFMIVHGRSQGGTAGLIAVDGTGSDTLVRLRDSSSAVLIDGTNGTPLSSLIPSDAAFLFHYRRDANGAVWGSINGEALAQSATSGVPKPNRIGNRGDRFGQWNERFYDVAVFDRSATGYDPAAAIATALDIVDQINSAP